MVRDLEKLEKLNGHINENIEMELNLDNKIGFDNVIKRVIDVIKSNEKSLNMEEFKDMKEDITRIIKELKEYKDLFIWTLSTLVYESRVCNNR
ncbi:uncharacterized protein CBO05P1_192 [Clostridium botulinum B str. Osaka05]|uniref:Uncharacterized protein n=1 Tax=Clostridium botulinum B str. Osaka05 TaxID=1407017 RepID=A0A060N378_CLOBO|nr:hypothetical protein [Clostridium botulinum]BAO04911.1 uncharacterized protein CBO05P1_192 [Clostridium botulinum B str. Osaka05]